MNLNKYLKLIIVAALGIFLGVNTLNVQAEEKTDAQEESQTIDSVIDSVLTDVGNQAAFELQAQEKVKELKSSEVEILVNVLEGKEKLTEEEKLLLNFSHERIKNERIEKVAVTILMIVLLIMLLKV